VGDCAYTDTYGASKIHLTRSSPTGVWDGALANCTSFGETKAHSSLQSIYPAGVGRAHGNCTSFGESKTP
jgi:hypothetical protein